MDGDDGIESDALQAGGHRFDPGHVHQFPSETGGFFREAQVEAGASVTSVLRYEIEESSAQVRYKKVQGAPNQDRRKRNGAAGDRPGVTRNHGSFSPRPEPFLMAEACSQNRLACP
jgi:hypothetical protein